MNLNHLNDGCDDAEPGEKPADADGGHVAEGGGDDDPAEAADGVREEDGLLAAPNVRQEPGQRGAEQLADVDDARFIWSHRLIIPSASRIRTLLLRTHDRVLDLGDLPLAGELRHEDGIVADHGTDARAHEEADYDHRRLKRVMSNKVEVETMERKRPFV